MEETLYIVKLFQEVEELRLKAGLSIDILSSFLDVTRKTYIEWRYERSVPDSKREIQFVKLTKVLRSALKEGVLPENNSKLKGFALNVILHDLNR